MLNSILQWLTDPAQWSGPDGIPTRALQHVEYSLVTLLIATAVATPLGLFIGHTGRGRSLISVANSLRAVPSLGLLFAISLWVGPKIQGSLAFVIPSIIVLVLLAIPPILSGTYAGIEGVDPAARDAAKGMGMHGFQVLRVVELPCALPLFMSGLRSASLQVIATATIASSVSLGGLGRYLIDGLASSQYEVMAGGAVCVAVLALLIDLAMAGLQRAVVSPGLTGKFKRYGAVAPDGRLPAEELTIATMS